MPSIVAAACGVLAHSSGPPAELSLLPCLLQV